jgi:hypothetical protein
MSCSLNAAPAYPASVATSASSATACSGCKRREGHGQGVGKMAVSGGEGSQFEMAPGPIKLTFKAFVRWKGTLHELVIERAAEEAG